MEVKIYATNLTNKPSPRAPMYNNDWRISETNLVPAACAVCGVKTEHTRLWPLQIYKESLTSYWSPWFDNRIPDKGDTVGREIQNQLDDRTG
jgi:hypothetical protein